MQPNPENAFMATKIAGSTQKDRLETMHITKYNIVYIIEKTYGIRIQKKPYISYVENLALYFLKQNRDVDKRFPIRWVSIFLN